LTPKPLKQLLLGATAKAVEFDPKMIEQKLQTLDHDVKHMVMDVMAHASQTALGQMSQATRADVAALRVSMAKELTKRPDAQKLKTVIGEVDAILANRQAKWKQWLAEMSKVKPTPDAEEKEFLKKIQHKIATSLSNCENLKGVVDKVFDDLKSSANLKKDDELYQLIDFGSVAHRLSELIKQIEEVNKKASSWHL